MLREVAISGLLFSGSLRRTYPSLIYRLNPKPKRFRQVLYSHFSVWARGVKEMSENVGIMAWVCLLSQNQDLTKWFIMQCIKEASTLRISPKKTNLLPE